MRYLKVNLLREERIAIQVLISGNIVHLMTVSALVVYTLNPSFGEQRSSHPPLSQRHRCFA